MRKIIVYCMMALSVFALMNTNFIDVVNAEEGDVYCTFEGGIVTDTTFEMNGINVTGTGGASIDDSPVYAGSRSWLHQTNDVTNISFDENHRDISFWYYHSSTTSVTDLYFKCYNDDNEQLLEFLFKSDDMYSVDHTSTQTKIDDCAVGHWNFLRITMNASDEVYFQSQYDSDTWGNLTDTPRYVRDNYNISYMKLTGASNSDWDLDNIAYNDNEDESNPQLTGLLIKQDGTTGIRDCDLYDEIAYTVIPTGEQFSRGVMVIRNNDTSSNIYTNTNIIYPIYTAISPFTTSRSYGTEGNYSIHLYDYFYPSTGYNQWYEFEVTDSGELDPCPILNGVLITTNDIGGVQNTGSNEQVTYDLYLYGDVGCSALVKIYDDDGYIIYQHVFYKTSSVYEYEFYMNYNHAGDDFLFYVRDNKYGICDDAIFEDSEYFNVLNGSFIPDDYIDVYGDNFTIFYDNIGQSCYYQAGDSTKNRLQLLFLIPSTFKEAIGDYLHVRIWKVVGDQYTADTLVYSHSFYNDFDRLTFWEINTLYVTEGTYRLYMYVAYNNVVNEMRFRETTIWEDYVDVCAYGGTNTNPYVPPDPYDPDSFGYGMLPPLSQPLGSIVGFIIVFVSLLIPIMIGGKVDTDIPMFVYAISGGTGLAVSSIMGFFPPWIIFFVVAVGIIAVFLTYFIGKTRGGE